MNSGIIQDARSLAWIHLQPAGTPDLLVGIPKGDNHIFAWIETKRSSGGRLNVDQVRELRKINKLGTPWLVADSFEDAQKWFEDFSYHGKDIYTKDVLIETERFVTDKKRPRNAKLSMSEFLQFDRWAAKKEGRADGTLGL